jgi:O-antigen/teichoic acid export membrane protein
MALYTRIARQRPVELWEDQRRFLVTITVAVSGCIAVAVAVAPWVIPAIFGKRFDEAVGLFQVLSIALVGMTVATLMGPQWIARGRFLATAAIGLGYGLLNLGLCLLFVPRWGAEGAALATAITYTLMLIPQIALALRCEREYRRAGGDGSALVTASGLAAAD